MQFDSCSLKPPGFNHCAYEVRNSCFKVCFFQILNLYRYDLEASPSWALQQRLHSLEVGPVQVESSLTHSLKPLGSNP